MRDNELRVGLRHAHLPWHFSRWPVWPTQESGRVVWAVYASTCPRCPECGGEGGRWHGGPSGEDPDWSECALCAPPWFEVRVPGWLDRALPGSLLRRRRRAAALGDEVPF